MNIDSIKNIKDGNQDNIDSLNKGVINTAKYNDYQLELDILSATLKADFTQNDLLIELEKLINTTKQTDNGLDHIIKQYYEKIKKADFTQDPILRAELQTKIDNRKIDIVTAHNNYKTEKAWINRTTHEILYRDQLKPNEIKEYERSQLTEISNLKNDISEVAKELRKKDPNFNKNSGAQDYMGNKDDLDQAEEMAYIEIMQTTIYMDSFSKSNNLNMVLPGGAGSLTFKNQADKLLYTKLFLETLRNGLNENSDDVITGYLAIGGGVIAVGFTAKWVFKKMLLNPIMAMVGGVKNIITGKGKESSTESTTEIVSESKEGITRNQKLELIEKYKESKLKLNTTTYNEVFLELNELESKIKGGKLDKLNKIQFANVLMYLDTESHLEYRGGKSILGIKPHKMKEIDIRTVESFIKDIEIGEQKTSYTFEGSTETIEFSKLENLDKNFSKIESKLLEVTNLEKAKELQIEFTSHNNRLTVIQGNKATTTSTLSSTTGTRTNTIENPTYKQILVEETNAQEKIEKTKLEYTKLGYSNIETFDINAEITTTKRAITTEINAINRTIGLTRTNRISLSTGTNWVKELKTDIIKAIKHR